jgi:hypothetical protein
MLLFQIEPDKNEKLFKKFEKILKTKCLKNEKVILNCYKNKIELKCKYGDPIDSVISGVEKEMNEGDPNWWIDILD